MRKLDPPRSDKLASFIPFGNAVEQLCEHLEAAELNEHLVNPLLIQDLVDKLPDVEKRQWIRFKREFKAVPLRTLTDFLNEIVADACEANVNFDDKPAGKMGGHTHSKGKGAVYHHSEDDLSDLGQHNDYRLEKD